MNIFSMVMLTLTKENMNQIIPLGERLRGLADRFHFNRLSMVGEGIHLSLPGKDEYLAFLREYIQAAEQNTVLGFKDNMINLLMHQKGLKPFDGCAGYGCGAAFNFLALLPDGEIHACRKLPSYLGNINNQSISEIYDSELANRYRSGCLACKGCPIRAVCGGCLAVSNSYGLNIFEEKDPFCFIHFSHSRQ
jgi:selenobiotic family peptide radical SAM maturase